MTETRIRLYAKGTSGFVASYGKVSDIKWPGVSTPWNLYFKSNGHEVTTNLDYVIEDFEVPDEALG